MRDFWYLEHTADLKFRAQGKTLRKCFINSARALTNSMVGLDSIDVRKDKRISLQNRELDILLNEFLTELVYLFDADHLLFISYWLEIKEEKDRYFLQAKMKGEEFSKRKHEIKTHIKAVTFHNLFIEKQGDRWVAQVVCDI